MYLNLIQQSIDWQEFWQLILGDISLTYVAAFYFYSNIGMLLTMFIHYQKHKRKVKKNNEEFKPNIWFWIVDNFKRFMANEIIVFIVLRFGGNIHSKLENRSLWMAFSIGLGMDILIIFFRNKTPLNWFQSKK